MANWNGNMNWKIEAAVEIRLLATEGIRRGKDRVIASMVTDADLEYAAIIESAYGECDAVWKKRFARLSDKLTTLAAMEKPPSNILRGIALDAARKLDGESQ